MYHFVQNFFKPEILNQLEFPLGENFCVLVYWNHRLADTGCWNIDLLADLAEIIPVRTKCQNISETFELFQWDFL